jgi:hypothetical protein
MSLEHAQEVLKKQEELTKGMFDKNDIRAVFTSQILVVLIEEVRLLRNDLSKLNQNE